MLPKKSDTPKKSPPNEAPLKIKGDLNDVLFASVGKKGLDKPKKNKTKKTP